MTGPQCGDEECDEHGPENYLPPDIKAMLWVLAVMLIVGIAIIIGVWT